MKFIKRTIRSFSSFTVSNYSGNWLTFNIMIMDYILDGKEFNMGNNLSTLSIIRRDRDPRSPRLDWGESNRYKKYGYLYDQRLFRGDSAFNETIVGWNGHMENGSTMMPVGGKYSVFISKRTEERGCYELIL